MSWLIEEYERRERQARQRREDDVSEGHDVLDVVESALKLSQEPQITTKALKEHQVVESALTLSQEPQITTKALKKHHRSSSTSKKSKKKKGKNSSKHGGQETPSEHSDDSKPSSTRSKRRDVQQQPGELTGTPIPSEFLLSTPRRSTPSSARMKRNHVGLKQPSPDVVREYLASSEWQGHMKELDDWKSFRQVRRSRHGISRTRSSVDIPPPPSGGLLRKTSDSAIPSATMMSSSFRGYIPRRGSTGEMMMEHHSSPAPNAEFSLDPKEAEQRRKALSRYSKSARSQRSSRHSRTSK